ncbi:MAG TPA: hypothetical protein PKE29_08180 [Phycisphaerales bacterium]|nr:hypothetical protein [Phycisphaerales bacterium]
MMTHELMEMASLDAMGLLDPSERETFERAFQAADPAIQAQIRREQLRFSGMDDVLPRVAPPLGLRARVIAAVREAIASSSRRDSDAIPIRSAGSVSRFWRVGAFGAMAAALVLGYFTVQFSQASRELRTANVSLPIDENFVREYGNGFKSLFLNPDAQFVSFVAATDAPDLKAARARIVFDPVKKQAQLFVQDLPRTEGQYEVVVIDAHGNTAQALITFSAPTAGLNAATIPNLDMENARQLLIRLQGSKNAILKSSGT